MNSNFQKRLYDTEVAPPQKVWEKLSDCLYEINSDNLSANKILGTELAPPPAMWGKITESLYEKDKSEFKKRSITISLKKLAAAAVFTGLIVSAWFLLFNNGQKNTSLVANETLPVNKKIILPDRNASMPVLSENESNHTQSSKPSFAENKKLAGNTRFSIVQTRRLIEPAVLTEKKFIAFQDEKPGDKIFDKPIDDLSLVSIDDHFMSMVNTNGRMVKIPVHLAHLVPHLQDKPISEDYYEILFGEGTFWKNKLNDWRQMLATAPVSSGDIFSNFVELIKSVQARQNEPDGLGK